MSIQKRRLENTFLRSLLASLDNLECFLIGNTSNFRQRYRELRGFFVSLVFYYTNVSRSSIMQPSNILALLRAFAFVGFDLSRRYCGRGVFEGSAGADDLTFRSS